MTARILPFPNFFRPASPRDEMGVIIILPIVRIERECPRSQSFAGSPSDCGNISNGVTANGLSRMDSAGDRNWLSADRCAWRFVDRVRPVEAIAARHHRVAVIL